VLDVSEIPPFTEVECPDCAHQAVVPARLGNFRLLRLIGKGGMGGVYHAVDESLGRDVAIKVMLKSLGDDAEFVETFRREAQAAAQLNHPHIAQIYSTDQEAGQPYIVMELVSGKRLDSMMEKQGALDQSFLVQVILEIANGLSAATDIGLIHGDIKPENILFDEKGQAKLVDFGLASFVHQQAAGGIWGTPYYIAPEKVRRQKVDARSDIYCLGATFYHALTGRPPFEGKTPVEVVKARLKDLPPPPVEVREGLSQKVSDIVMRMLQISPSRRYPTYASLISDLKRVADELPKPRNPTLTRTFKKRVRGKRRVTGPVSPSETANLGSTSSSRIVINKSSPGTDSPLSDYNPLKEAAADEGVRRKKRNTVLGALLSIVLLAGLGGGGFFGYMKYRETVELRNLRRAYFERVNTAEQLYEDLGEQVATVEGYPKKYAGTMASMTNDLTAMAGVPKPDELPEDSGYSRRHDIKSDIMKRAGAIREAGRRVRGYVNRIDLVVKDLKAAMAVGDKASLDLTEADERIDKIRDTIKDAQEAATLCEEKLKEMGTLKDELHSIRTKVVEDREAAEAEAAEKKRREDEARKKREEEEKQKKAKEAELARAKAAVESVKGSARTRKYADAANTLRKELGDLKFDEAKDIVKPALDRFNHLIDLQKGVVAMLAAKPLPWGWKQDGGQGLDVLGASPKAVRIKGGRTVPWSQVRAPQMFEFVKHYAGLRSGSSKVRGKRKLETAVFCYVGGDSESARRLAKEYAGDAVNAVPSLRQEVDRIMPGL